MTPAEAMEVGSRLIQLLTQQQLLYRQLQELSRRQSRLVDGSDPEALLGVLGNRQRLIDRLTIISRDLEPIRQDWDRISGSLPEAQREEAQRLVGNVQEILRDILQQDQKDTECLSQQKQQVAGQIRTAAGGQRMHKAYSQSAGYGAGAPAGGHYLDTHSG